METWKPEFSAADKRDAMGIGDTKLDSVLSKVRGLVAKAEHPDTPETEARLCREKADAMMLKYAIDQAMIRQSQPEATRARPGKIKVDVCDAGSDYERMFIDLVCVVCEHTRSKPMFIGAEMNAGVLYDYNRYRTTKLQVRATIYGFESDLKYFEILYTTLLLHMSNGIDPRFDTSKSDRANAYDLHNAGFNWGHIAQMAYKIGHEYGWDGIDCASRGLPYPGKYWKQQYNAEIRSRGEQAVRLPAKFTDSARVTWRLNFAKSYVSTIRRRLWIAREKNAGSGELVLKSAMDEVIAMMNQECPQSKEMSAAKDVPFNETAWEAGNRHAKLADLGGQSVAGKSAGAIG